MIITQGYGSGFLITQGYLGIAAEVRGSFVLTQGYGSAFLVTQGFGA